MEKEPEIPEGIAEHQESRDRHRYIKDSLGDFQNCGPVGDPRGQRNSFIGEAQEKYQGQESEKNFQLRPRAAAGQPFENHLHEKMRSFPPQSRDSEEDHPGKGQFNDFIEPSHGHERNKPGEYAGGDHHKKNDKAADRPPVQDPADPQVKVYQ